MPGPSIRAGSPWTLHPAGPMTTLERAYLGHGTLDPGSMTLNLGAYLLGPPPDCTICMLRLPTMTSVSSHVSVSELGPLYGVAHWMVYVHAVLLGPVFPPVVWQTFVTPDGGEAVAVPAEIPAGACTTGNSRQ